jgi:chromosome segregation ATPase
MDIERTMAHVVEQQSKFESDIAKINETIRGLAETLRLQVEVSRLQSERTDRLEHDMAKGFATIVDAHNRLAQAQEETDRRLGKLALAHEDLARAHEDLTRAQAGTERRLNDFIAQVARHVASGNGSKGRKGGPTRHKD